MSKNIVLHEKVEIPINRNIIEESARFNTQAIGWYKLVINGIYYLIFFTLSMIALAGVFSLTKPFPMVYASTMEGELYPLDYARGIDEKLKQLHEQILVEEKSIEAIKKAGV